MSQKPKVKKVASYILFTNSTTESSSDVLDHQSIVLLLVLGDGYNNKESFLLSFTTVDWKITGEDSRRDSGIGVSWFFNIDDDKGLVVVVELFRVFVISAVGIERILESLPRKEVGPEGDE